MYFCVPSIKFGKFKLAIFLIQRGVQKYTKRERGHGPRAGVVEGQLGDADRRRDADEHAPGRQPGAAAAPVHTSTTNRCEGTRTRYRQFTL